MQTAEFRHVFACVYVRLHSVQRHFCVESKQFPCGRRESAEPSCLKALCVWSCTSSDTTEILSLFLSFSSSLPLCVRRWGFELFLLRLVPLMALKRGESAFPNKTTSQSCFCTMGFFV